MIPFFHIVLGEFQAFINLSMVESVSINTQGLDIHMVDCEASMFCPCDPAQAKAVFAAMLNAAAMYNFPMARIES